MGKSKTAHDRIMRYKGGFILHFSQITSFPPTGIPHFSQKGLVTLGTRD